MFYKNPCVNMKDEANVGLSENLPAKIKKGNLVAAGSGPLAAIQFPCASVYSPSLHHHKDSD